MDTLKISKDLQDVAFSKEQAETIARVMNEAWTKEVATKADLETAVARLESKIETAKSEFSNRLLVHTGVIIAAVFAMLKWMHGG
jgi:hypothetical protein